VPVCVRLNVAEKKEKPTVKPLTDVECTEQEDVRFETTVAGKPEPTVEWYDSPLVHVIVYVTFALS